MASGRNNYFFNENLRLMEELIAKRRRQQMLDGTPVNLLNSKLNPLFHNVEKWPNIL